MKCQARNKKYELKLAECVQQMKQIIDQDIIQHLTEAHLEIYDTYAKDFEYLRTDNRTWEWWWFASNPWWNNTPCPPCNVLYDARKAEIEIIDK